MGLLLAPASAATADPLEDVSVNRYTGSVVAADVSSPYYMTLDLTDGTHYFTAAPYTGRLKLSAVPTGITNDGETPVCVSVFTTTVRLGSNCTSFETASHI